MKHLTSTITVGLLAASLVSVMALTAQAVTVPVTVKNPSFEIPDLAQGAYTMASDPDPVPGWTLENLDPVGEYQVGIVEMNDPLDHGAADGDNALYINTADAVSQTLAAKAIPGDQYILTVSLSRRRDFAPNPYLIELQVGGVTVASDSNSVTLPGPPPAWVDSATVTYTAQAADYGKPLGIRISVPSHDGVQTIFDNVRLQRVVNSRVWTYQGTSGLAISPSHAGMLQDRNRIRIYDMVVDNDGNLFFTSGYNGINDGEASYPHGVTIMKPLVAQPQGPSDWTKIDVNLSTAGANVPGGIVKMVVAGDGEVYALQSWQEINWNYDDGLDSRLIRIGDNGQVTVAVNFGTSGRWENALESPKGIAVGSDGHIYYTRAGWDGYWKYHYFWRYNVNTGLPEESPVSANQGWSETHRMVDLEYVEDGWFAVIGGSSDGNNRFASAIGWGLFRRMATGAEFNPGWGVSHNLKTSYDPVRNKLWLATRGNFGNNDFTNILFRWNGDPSNVGLFSGSNDPVGGVSQSICPLTGQGNDRPDAWHANMNDPGTPTPPPYHNNGGPYWPAAFKVNPASGACWMSWAAATSYTWNGTYGEVGPIYTMQPNECGLSGNENDPQDFHPTGGTHPSQTLALAFAGGYIYALTVDLATGEFNLFSAQNPDAIPGACCLPGRGIQCDDDMTASDCGQAFGYWHGPYTTCENVDCAYSVCHDPFADADGDLDVDQDDFGVLQACITGQSGGPPAGYPPRNCSCFDANGNGDVAGTDIGEFENCASGPGVESSAACDD